MEIIINGNYYPLKKIVGMMMLNIQPFVDTFYAIRRNEH